MKYLIILSLFALISCGGDGGDAAPAGTNPTKNTPEVPLGHTIIEGTITFILNTVVSEAYALEPCLVQDNSRLYDRLVHNCGITNCLAVEGEKCAFLIKDNTLISNTIVNNSRYRFTEELDDNSNYTIRVEAYSDSEYKRSSIFRKFEIMGDFNISPVTTFISGKKREVLNLLPAPLNILNLNDALVDFLSELLNYEISNLDFFLGLSTLDDINLFTDDSMGELFDILDLLNGDLELLSEQDLQLKLDIIQQNMQNLGVEWDSNVERIMELSADVQDVQYLLDVAVTEKIELESILSEINGNILLVQSGIDSFNLLKAEYAIFYPIYIAELNEWQELTEDSYFSISYQASVYPSLIGFFPEEIENFIDNNSQIELAMTEICNGKLAELLILTGELSNQELLVEGKSSEIQGFQSLIDQLEETKSGQLPILNRRQSQIDRLFFWLSYVNSAIFEVLSRMT